MSRKLRTNSRSYLTICREANRCREVGGLTTSILFNITEFIRSSLVPYFRGRLKVVLENRNAFSEPARVDISSDRSSIVLRVKTEIWEGAQQGNGECRRILAHEIGHIWLHKDETFAFSEVSDAEHPYIPRDELVEEQAHDFADAFLLADDAIKGFERISDIMDYCESVAEIPIDVVERRFKIFSEAKRYYFKPKYGHLLCPSCGSDKVVEVLSYRKCDNCGKTQY